MDILGLPGGRVRADAVSFNRGIRPDKLEHKLTFGFGHGFPCLSQTEGLFFTGHFAGQAGDNGGRFQRVGGLHNGRPDVARRYHQQRDGFTVAFGDGNGLGEQSLLVVAEDLLHGQVIFSAAVSGKARFHDHNVLLMGVSDFQSPAQVVQRIGVADRDQHVAGTNLHGFTLNGLLVVKLKVFFHLLFNVTELAFVHVLGDGEDEEESEREDQTCHRGHLFGEQVHNRRGEQYQMHRGQADGKLDLPDLDIRRHTPPAFALVLEAQYQHGQAVEGKTPDHAESVSFAQDVNITAAGDDGDELHRHNQVDNAIAGAKALVRTAEPVSKNSVFRDAVQNAIGPDDRGIDGAGQDQETHDNNEDPEDELKQVRPDHVHGHSADQVVFVHADANRVRNDHDGQHGTDAGEHKTEYGNDQRGPLQVAQLGAGDLAINLGQGLFAAHGQ